MITDIQSPKLLVISDLHLGNPFSKARTQTVAFLKWACANKYDVCINGDGFEVAQVSFAKLARDIPDVLQALKAFTKSGQNVYYVVGNHDIVFENFLNDWGGFKVAPFLNCVSGSKRIRIEHGHLYDPMFIRNPDLYEFLTWFAGLALKVHPQLYKVWIWFESFVGSFQQKSRPGIDGEDENFMMAAEELMARGFDEVIFGHTHHKGEVQVDAQHKYYNSGSWLMSYPYIEIVDGRSQMKEWKPLVA